MFKDISNYMEYSSLTSLKRGNELIAKLYKLNLKHKNDNDECKVPMFIKYPDSLVEKIHHLEIGEKVFVKNFYLRDFPSQIHPQWLDEFISYPTNMVTSFVIKPLEKDVVIKALKRQIVKDKEKIISNEKKGKFIDPYNIDSIENLEELYILIEKGTENLFYVSSNMGLYSGDLESLESLHKKIVALSESMGMHLRNSSFRQLKSFSMLLPNTDVFVENNILDTTSLSYSSIFSSSNIVERGGIFYGVNKNTNEIVVMNRFNRENYNSITLAKSGMGKSYEAKLEILRSLRNGVQVFVIDLEGEYVDLCNAMGGNVININFGSKSLLNPFFINPISISEQVVEEKIQFLKSFFKKLCNYYDANIMDEALINIYKNKDPSMLMLDRELLRMGYRAREMRKNLFSVVYGSAKSLYNNDDGYIDLDNKLTVFNISLLDEVNKSLVFFVITEYIWNIVKTDRTKKRILVIDEAHKLLDELSILQYFKGLTKRSRKYNLGLFFISQDIGDFIKNADGAAIVSNCATKLLLGQEGINIRSIKESFGLSNREGDLLKELDKGEALLIAGQARALINIKALPLEEKLILVNKSM